MKTFSWLACSLTLASALASCGYDNRPYGYTPAGYNSGYSAYSASYSAPTYGYRPSYRGTYTSNRYLVPVNTPTYGYGVPLASRMSVGGYGYIQPAPPRAPWPLQ